MFIPERHVLINENGANFKDILLKRGISSAVFVAPSPNMVTENTEVYHCHIFDATYNDISLQNISTKDLIIIYNCTEANLPTILSKYPKHTIFAIKNEKTCLEYLYFLVTHIAYFPKIGLDLYFDFACKTEEISTEYRILNCIDAAEVNSLSKNVECFYIHVEPNTEYSFFEYFDETSKILSGLDNLLGYGLTLADDCTRTRTLFLYEKFQAKQDKI